MQSAQISDAATLAMLLTAESLIFAVLSATIAFAQPGKRVTALPASAYTLGSCAVGLLVTVALGGLMAWIGVFADHWPCSLRQEIVAVAILIAIVGQPILATAIARGLKVRD